MDENARATASAAGSEPCLARWNDTACVYPQDRCVHELFAEQAMRTPEAVAVSYEGKLLTYRQLDERGNQLAHWLRGLGVGPETIVALCLPRSLELVIGLLGILKAGGAYLPVDSAYPRERIAFMLENAAASVIVTSAATVGGQLGESLPVGGAVVQLDTDWPNIAAQPSTAPSTGLRPDNLAYFIYTSGSTGKPKGVMNIHRALTNRLHWMQQAYGLTAADRVLQKTPYTFDVSVWEFLWPLMYGATLVIARPEGHKDPFYLRELICKASITTLHFVPSMLEVFLATPGVAACLSIRRVICSGEALPDSLRARFFETLQSELHNLYGPTEAAIDVTYWQCSRSDDRGYVPIGRPISNIRVYVLDQHLASAPIDTVGDLYLGGVGLARGYRGRAGLTAERFVADPFMPGERLYRTGDLARWRPDGTLEFLGRVDYQVKIRGFRIELGEIEAAFCSHPQVREAIVLAQEDSSGDKRLAAYVVPTWSANKPGAPRHLLPNGKRIFHQNKSETEFVYREIYEQQTYLQYGITLPEDACVFDVGANIGLFMLYVAEHCPRGRIYAFEPLPAIFETLRNNASICDAEAIVFPIGLSDQEGLADFTYYPGNTIMSGMKSSADSAEDLAIVKTFLGNQESQEPASRALLDNADEWLGEIMHGETFLCRLRRLSDVMREEHVEHIDLLKIDVERAEWEVLQGIDASDWHKIDHIVLEVHDQVRGYAGSRVLDITDFLKRRGYEVAVEESRDVRGGGLYNLYAVRPMDARAPRPAMGACVEADGHTRAIVTPPRLRRYVQDKLLEHMVPAAIILLDALPLTANGKVDRQALLAPDWGKSLQKRYVAPRTPVEESLALAWAEVLHLERIGIDDNFFELGGHSLQAIRLLSRLQSTFGASLSLTTLFALPTLAAMAERIEQSVAQPLPAIASVAREAPLELSFAQQRLWFLAQLEGVSSAYHISLGMRLTGPLDRAALRSSLNSLLARHEALRTVFGVHHGEPQATLLPADCGFAWVEQDLQSSVDAPERLEQSRIEEALMPFDLSSGPLIRGRLIRIGAEQHVLLLTLHHIVSDGWSISVLFSEIRALYAAGIAGQDDPLPPLAIQYPDFAVWQRRWLLGDRLQTQAQYWRKQLADVPTLLELATDRPRPAQQSLSGASLEIAVDADLTRALKHLGQQHGVTLFMSLLAAWAAVLSQLSGQEDLVVGTVTANRNRQELEPLIGLFVNTLALRIDLSGEPSAAELLARVRKTTLAAQDHQDLPFEQVVEIVQPPRRLAHTPLYQVMLAWQNNDLAVLDLPGLQVQPMAAPQDNVKFDLVLELAESTDGIVGRFNYATALFDATTIERQREYLLNVLQAMLVDASQPVARAELFSSSSKLDRKVLPKPDLQAMAMYVYEPPQGEIEQTLAGLWSERLGVERIGRQDHFFARGGNSLLLIKLCFQLNEVFGINLGIGRLYEAPALHQMALLIERAKSKTAAKKSTIVLSI